MLTSAIMWVWVWVQNFLWVLECGVWTECCKSSNIILILVTRRRTLTFYEPPAHVLMTAPLNGDISHNLSQKCHYSIIECIWLMDLCHSLSCHHLTMILPQAEKTRLAVANFTVQVSIHFVIIVIIHYFLSKPFLAAFLLFLVFSHLSIFALSPFESLSFTSLLLQQTVEISPAARKMGTKLQQSRYVKAKFAVLDKYWMTSSGWGDAIFALASAWDDEVYLTF